MAQKGSMVLTVNGLTNMQRHQIVEFCLDQLGKEYALDTPLSYSSDTSSWYCSELAWAAYKNAGVELLPDVGWYISPDQIYYIDTTARKRITDDMPADAFNDNNASWSADSIEFLANNGIMTGTGLYKFSPNITLTRAMIVTVLHRLEGSLAPVSTESPFDDVQNPNVYYYDAVLWGYDQGIIYGVTESIFAPNQVVTREQFATFLYRFAVHMDYDCSFNNNALVAFSDGSSVSTYALTPMKWAVTHELINGMSATVLSPKKGSTRAQTAVIIYRFIDNIMSD